MNTAIESTPDTTASASRGRIRLGGLAVVGLLAVTACTSDPGPRRVAQDIIKAEALDNPALNETCMLEVLNEFSDDQLKAIAEDLDSTATDMRQVAEAELARYSAALDACNA